MNFPRINLVVVGHKDHGKSTLIRRLLYDLELYRNAFRDILLGVLGLLKTTWMATCIENLLKKAS